MIDPRADDCIAGEAESHGGIKDSKVVWVGQNSDRILTTGFSTVIKLLPLCSSNDSALMNERVGRPSSVTIGRVLSLLSILQMMLQT